MILRDYQLSPGSLRLNAATFPFNEAVCLDLSRRRPRAPFVKIQLTLDGHRSEGRTVLHCDGICEAFVPADVAELERALPSTDGLIRAALDGLDAIKRDIGFEDPAIAALLRTCASRVPPCQHRLERLTRTTRSGLRCETWFIASADRGAIEVRMHDGDVEVLRAAVRTSDAPWTLRDPALKAARLSGGRYLVLDRAGAVIFDVELPQDRRGHP